MAYHWPVMNMKKKEECRSKSKNRCCFISFKKRISRQMEWLLLIFFFLVPQSHVTRRTDVGDLSDIRRSMDGRNIGPVHFLLALNSSTRQAISAVDCQPVCRRNNSLIFGWIWRAHISIDSPWLVLLKVFWDQNNTVKRWAANWRQISRMTASTGSPRTVLSGRTRVWIVFIPKRKL